MLKLATLGHVFHQQQKKRKKKKGHHDNSDNNMSFCGSGFLFKWDHFPGTFGDLSPKQISSTQA